ncbi:MAG: BatD family protein [Bacteroidetes bacterium]|nr:BatD family protein [Bacteroidota bacterium]MDA0860254.1 BatD family protein [Bacteroidota bacterium]MDA1318462.1 BatD family protein [Bacteroidota bacterium]
MKFRLLLLLIFLSSFAMSQVKFEAKTSKTQLGVNERLRIDFTMNEDGDNFIPPSFENFKVVGGPSQSINNSWINGVRSFSKSYTYFLSPTKRGTFTIGQSSIEIDGNTYKTSPIQITVTAAVEIPKDPNDPNYIASESIHLVAEVSTTKPYLNEPVSVIYKLYVAENTGVRNWSELDSPSYNDFWSQNIEVNRQNVKEGKYKGENYRYVVLKKTVLYPQKTGKLSIEPLTLDVSVEVPSKRRDVFGRLMMITTNRNVTAGKRTIDVKPLPSDGRPDDFSGAVGSFEFNMTSNKNTLKATEAFDLKLEVSGKGNLKLFKLPKPNLPSALEVYEPEHSEKVSTNLSGMRGSISDTYTVVPNAQGRYPIPTVSFSYFDLNTETYKTLKSNELVVAVTDDAELSSNENSATKEVQKTNVTTLSKQFSSFKSNGNLEPITKTNFYSTPLFWWLFFGPLLLIPLVIIITRNRGKRALDIEGNKIRQTNRLARKYLSSSKKAIGNKEAFYVALERALHNYLKSRLKIETSDFSKEKIDQLLTKKEVQKEASSQFLDVLKSCELARYTPLGVADMERDYQKAVETINTLDKQLK